MGNESILASPGEHVVRRRTRRDPIPRFKGDKSGQLDAIAGCPELQVEQEHLARRVWGIVAKLDVSAIEATYSSLGRHGYHPRNVLAVWVYASLIGIHHSTKVALALRTDAAFRLLSGGHAISAPRLRAFRQKHWRYLLAAIEQTVAMAKEAGLLDGSDLAIDSLRLRAYASTKEARTLSRSQKRLEELAAVDVAALDPVELEAHQAKVAKHRFAVEQCEAQQRASIVLTNPSAAMMKFPEAGSLPGHRVTVVAAGVKARLVLTVLVDADTHDHGKAGPSLRQAREVLARIGVLDGRLQAAADAGYWSEDDLIFALDNRDWVDLLLDEPAPSPRDKLYFARDHFKIHDDGRVTCPAGRDMRGPWSSGFFLRYSGVGCATCPLKPQCTPARERAFTLRPALEQARTAMQARMKQPDADARYHRRMATVEPVFSNIESTMGYRRATTRHSDGLLGEILIKILAHNISRLLAARKLAPLSLVLLPANEF